LQSKSMFKAMRGMFVNPRYSDRIVIVNAKELKEYMNIYI